MFHNTRFAVACEFSFIFTATWDRGLQGSILIFIASVKKMIARGYAHHQSWAQAFLYIHAASMKARFQSRKLPLGNQPTKQQVIKQSATASEPANNG